MFRDFIRTYNQANILSEHIIIDCIALAINQWKNGATNFDYIIGYDIVIDYMIVKYRLRYG